MVMSYFWLEVEIWPFCTCAIKNMQFGLIYGQIAKIPVSYTKYGSGNTLVTSYFWPDVEIWPFRACVMKNIQLGSYLWPNHLWTRLWGRYHVPYFLLFQGHIVLYYMWCVLQTVVANRLLSLNLWQSAVTHIDWCWLVGTWCRQWPMRMWLRNNWEELRHIRPCQVNDYVSVS